MLYAADYASGSTRFSNRSANNQSIADDYATWIRSVICLIQNDNAADGEASHVI